MARNHKLDRIDLRILSTLQLDGRIPNVKLADAVGLTPSPCLERLKRLEQAGYIRRYGAEIDCPIAFAEQAVPNTLAEALAAAGARQLHAAETEKYPHVTYFFNGGREQPWPGEERRLADSPRDVPNYDFKPEMSAAAIADRFCAAIGDGFRFGVVNFANPDMVGHTGSIPAVIRAIETVDGCLARVVAAVHAADGICLVTADHGNAEKMLEDDGVSPHTAHTTNPVPLIVTAAGRRLRDGGEASDLAPTILALLGIPQPAEMTGRTLVG